jgi:hypothetical protein
VRARHVIQPYLPKPVGAQRSDDDQADAHGKRENRAIGAIALRKEREAHSSADDREQTQQRVPEWSEWSESELDSQAAFEHKHVDCSGYGQPGAATDSEGRKDGVISGDKRQAPSRASKTTTVLKLVPSTS